MRKDQLISLCGLVLLFVNLLLLHYKMISVAVNIITAAAILSGVILIKVRVKMYRIRRSRAH
jgi:hypothetical protein